MSFSIYFSKLNMLPITIEFIKFKSNKQTIGIYSKHFLSKQITKTNLKIKFYGVYAKKAQAANIPKIYIK